MIDKILCIELILVFHCYFYFYIYFHFDCMELTSSFFVDFFSKNFILSLILFGYMTCETAMFHFLVGEDSDGTPRLSREDMDQLLLDPSR